MNKDGYCSFQYPIHLVCLIKINPLQSIEISLYLAFTNEWNVAKKEKLLMNDLFYLEILFYNNNNNNHKAS
jgi:hypothetical protein